VLQFEPRFPLQPGVRYRAVLGGSAPVALSFAIPQAAPGPAPRVAQVYPTGDRLPENQLKFYLQFTAPMRQGEVYRRVALLGESGEPIEAPFLELEQELWDPSGTRLTLLLDPGRIKRGLVPHEEVGVALESGRRYALRIDPAWPGANGVPLAAAFRKDFAAVAADREPLDPRRWTLRAPARGSREPLVVSFPEPLDWALLERLLSVRGERGAPLPGSVFVAQHETQWRFTPRDPWPPGAYVLALDAALEDLAGNRIGRPFDVDLRGPRLPEPARELLELPFQVR
jgi:hypothetical protein